MSRFEVGDRVRMPDAPIVVEVLELGVCGEANCCAEQTIRFRDPVFEGDDWAHSFEFVLAV